MLKNRSKTPCKHTVLPHPRRRDRPGSHPAEIEVLKHLTLGTSPAHLPGIRSVCKRPALPHPAGCPEPPAGPGTRGPGLGHRPREHGRRICRRRGEGPPWSCEGSKIIHGLLWRALRSAPRPLRTGSRKSFIPWQDFHPLGVNGVPAQTEHRFPEAVREG